MRNEIAMILKCLYIDTPHPAFLTLEPGYEAGFLSAAELDQYVGRAEYGLTERFVAREFARATSVSPSGRGRFW